MPVTDELARGLWRTGAIKFGDFVLKSGVHSPFYINLRFLISIPSVLRQSCEAMSAAAAGLKFDRVAGIPFAGLPLGVMVSQQLAVPLIYPRPEVKQHGDVRAIEGDYAPGETVLVVDDLITNGGAKIEAIKPLQEAGLKVKDIVVLIDREQGGVRLMAEKGYAVHSVMTVSELLDKLKGMGLISEDQFRTSIDYVRSVRF
jgi:orotate phosphoribosyltransferase